LLKEFHCTLIFTYWAAVFVAGRVPLYSYIVLGCNLLLKEFHCTPRFTYWAAIGGWRSSTVLQHLRIGLQFFAEGEEIFSSIGCRYFPGGPF
jgi:hypothetical protein